MRKTITAALVAIICLAGCSNHSPRTIEDFNFDWKFALGDAPEYAQPSFDDGSWRSLHLPHDWSIEGNFSKDNPSTPGGGALPGGIGWYRKHFKSPEAGRRVFVEFDGVFMNSTVYVGGKEMGTRPYGYSSFTYDITDALAAPGEDNLIAVRCDNSDQPNSRWYAGCGIYRNVRLVTVDPVHVAYSGVFVTTPEVSAESATVSVAVEVEAPEGAQYAVSNTILDARGRKVAEGTAELKVARPQLWDVDHPYLYTLVTRVESEGRLADEYRTRLGIRSFSYDIDHGFELNGRPLRMLGVCLHHDMGCLGTAVHRRALERELTIMREMGVNAIRTSHNPPAPELLELCDEMGLMVMDEAFDMWRKRKTEFDYARFFDEWHERDLVDFLKRDRNHPCIVMWSVGNEILEQWNSDEDDLKNLTAEQANLMMNFLSKLPHKDASDDNPNIRLTRHMVEIVKSLDTTRPVSSGCNETQPYNNLLKSGALDVYGFNYHLWDYDSCRVWYPNKPLYGSETVSSLNSRGVYFQPSTEEVSLPAHWWEIYESEHHQCTAYDACHAPWSNTHEDSWIAIRDREYMFGTFIWTGFDYLGEPTPYTWPSRSSYFGIVDLAGFPKDPYWMYMAEWTDKTVLHLFPHWNWKPGDKIDVWAYYNNADEVELFLNGRSLGRQSKTADVLHCNWQQVDWEPGEILAVSYKDGVEVARESRRTTGEPVGLRLTPDRPVIAADGYDLSYVTVEAIDAEGLAVPTADGMLRFKVSGAGELFGIDNGNAADTLSLKGCEKALFSGKALAVVRSLRDDRGTAELTVSGYGVEVTCPIRVK